MTLDRVINVYPDWERLAALAAARARRLFDLVYPRDTPMIRLDTSAINLSLLLLRKPVRVAARPTDAIERITRDNGLSPQFSLTVGPAWQVRRLPPPMIPQGDQRPGTSPRRSGANRSPRPSHALHARAGWNSRGSCTMREKPAVLPDADNSLQRTAGADGGCAIGSGAALGLVEYQHVAMRPAIFAMMPLRRDEYTRHVGHVAGNGRPAPLEPLITPGISGVDPTSFPA